MDCTKVSILAVILYYGFARHYHWGPLGERVHWISALFPTTECESTVISEKFNF